MTQELSTWDFGSSCNVGFERVCDVCVLGPLG